MSNKFRLFASVAAPFVSLPLMLQPAGAAPPRPAAEAAAMPGVIRVQQQIIVPPDARGGGEQGAGEGERQRPRRQQGGAEQGGGERQQAPAQAEQQGEQPRRQRQAAPDAAPREAPAAEAPAPERPRRQQQETGQDQGGGERQQQRRQQVGQGEGGGEQPLRRQQQAAPDAAPRQAPAAEAPAPERPRRQQQETGQGQRGGDGQPRRNAQQPDGQQPGTAPAGSQAETPTPRPRGTDRAATPEQAPATPDRRNAEGREPAQGGGTADDNRRRPPAADGQAGQGQQPQNAQQPPNAQPGENGQQRRQTTEGQQPAPVPGQAPRQQTSEGQPATGQPNTAQPNSGQPNSGQSNTAQPGAVQPGAAPPGAGQQAGSQPPAQAEPPRTPEQVERAREIARDPASARSGEQVVLPVENGAAVLDSAKEQPQGQPGMRQQRDGDRPRRQQQADQQQLAPPRSDAEAQEGTRITRQQQEDFRALAEQRGERLDARPQFDRPRGWDVREIGRGQDRERDRDGARVIISIDNQAYVRHDDSRRFYDERGGRPPQYERLRGGQVREVITRDDGTRIVTLRNQYGEIVQRSRIVRGGDEYVLYYAPELVNQRRGSDYVWRDPGDDLPPMRLTVPLDDYIIDTSSEPDRDYYEFLEQPPVERVERVYTLDEVRYSARIRDKVPRIDLDTITFATGSAEIPMNQASSLRKVADAISKVLDKDPSETFLIEGHTDAVGADESNLVLSDERAESVARVLTDAFNIPPENLTTQGYGERYLKVRTDGPNQENRRVTVRRITPLVKPVASNR